MKRAARRPRPDRDPVLLSDGVVRRRRGPKYWISSLDEAGVLRLSRAWKSGWKGFLRAIVAMGKATPEYESHHARTILCRLRKRWGVELFPLSRESPATARRRGLE